MGQRSVVQAADWIGLLFRSIIGGTWWFVRELRGEHAGEFYWTRIEPTESEGVRVLARERHMWTGSERLDLFCEEAQHDD